MSKNLVIVESPAKAKTIEKYLGGDFHVLSSVGHIRRDTNVDPNDNFAVTYEIDPDHKKVVTELKKAAKAADTVWLATDEDREGESISWHLLEVLKLPATTNRITFHEITKPALEAAIKSPRTVDMAMVSSQQARQSLDMLVGYDLSGVIRKKVPGARSAGRVQSPAVKLVVEKEREIENFAKKSTFKITGDFKKDNTTFAATLEKIAPDTPEKAKELLESFKNAKFTVSDIIKSDGKKANPVPFTTATLQIEANARLGFATGTTMRAAQALYQAGLITYHRTDSLNLSSEALAAMATYIEKTFGPEYLKTRHFRTKSASAQEAHEAIRPTDITKVSAGKNDFEKKLYNLIRTRTLATQMSEAKVAKTVIKIATKTAEGDFSELLSSRGKRSDEPRTLAPWDANCRGAANGREERSEKTPSAVFVAKGEIIVFDGFLKVYGKSKDLELPELKEGESVEMEKITARETFAKPPARYTEGALVKKLEELGIGRPSTYAGILSTIQSRGYVTKGEGEGRERKVAEITLKGQKITHETKTEKTGATKGKLLPTPVGELIADFLTDNFTKIVDYGFTADIETQLDQIAAKKLDRVRMLRAFYTPFAKLIQASDGITRYNSARELGTDPKTNKPIFAKIGKTGGFIQLGENEKEAGEKPRFAPLPKNKTVKTVTLEEALKQLALPALPRSLGKTKDGTELIAAAGPFGPYLKAGKYNIPLKGYDPYSIDLSIAEPLYAAKIDSIIADWGDVMIINGAYGPYIKGPGRRNNLKIPKDQDPKKITEGEARKLLENKPKTTTHRAPRRSTKAKKTTKPTKSTSKKSK